FSVELCSRSIFLFCRTLSFVFAESLHEGPANLISTQMKNHIIGRPPPALLAEEPDKESQQVEARNRRLNQLYKSLMRCNQAIIRSENETELFAEICRNVVDFDGTKMAFITLLDEQKQRLLPVTSYGSGTEYLENLDITVAENSPRGHGPI